MTQQWAGTKVLALALVAAVAASACAPREDSATADSLMGDTTGAMGVAGGTMTESAALGTVAAVHSAEIASGELAQERAQNAQVRQFAQRIENEHRAYLDRLQALNVSYDTTQADPALVRMADSTMQRLRTLTGAAFDTAWVNAQVAMHEGALQRLQSIAGQSSTGGQTGGSPSSPAGGAGAQPQSQAAGAQPPTGQTGAAQPGAAGTGNLSEYLQNTRQLIEQHLQSARQLQQQLGGTAGR